MVVIGISLMLWAASGQPDKPKRQEEPELSLTLAEPVPMLGEMLIHYDRLSRDDLNRALDQQRGTTKRLGQVLVEMALITPSVLHDMLEEQRSRKQRKYRWRGEYSR